MNAEAAYVFRHALLRDAAYQLQLPAERVKGHATAFAVITDLCGGLPPEGGPLDPTAPPAGLPHEADAFAAELAVHAGRGLASPEVCRRTTRRAAEVAEARHRAEDACALWQEHAALADPAGRAAALCRAGSAAEWSSRSAVARRMIARSLREYRGMGDLRGAGIVCTLLAEHHRTAGRVEAALRSARRAVACFQAAREPRWHGIALEVEGISHWLAGRPDEARRVIESALPLLRAAGDRIHEATCLGDLANIDHKQGRLREAEERFEKSFRIFEDIGNRRGMGQVLGNLALLYGSQERTDLIRPTLERAIGIHREVGNRHSESISQVNLANHLRDLGDFAGSGRLYDAALGFALDSGSRRLEGIVKCCRGMLLTLDRRAAEGREQWEEGAALLLAIGARHDHGVQVEAMKHYCEVAGVPPFDEGRA